MLSHSEVASPPDACGAQRLACRPFHSAARGASEGAPRRQGQAGMRFTWEGLLQAASAGGGNGLWNLMEPLTMPVENAIVPGQLASATLRRLQPRASAWSDVLRGAARGQQGNGMCNKPGFCVM